jgi:aconitate hydratase
VLAHSTGRIHGENLVNYGVLPLMFVEAADLKRLEKGTVLRFHDLHAWLRGTEPEWEITYGRDGHSEARIKVRHEMSPRQIDILLAGGAIPWTRRRIRQHQA